MQSEIRNLYPKKLIMLDKIYKDHDKFSDIGNNINFKVTIFFNTVNYVGLPEDVYI